MSFFRSTALLLAALIPFAAAAPTPQDVPSASPEFLVNRYIIELKPSVDEKKHLTWVNDIHARSLEKRDKTLPEFKGVEKNITIDDFKVYTGQFDESVINTIKANSDVLLVEKDQLMYMTDIDMAPVEEAKLDARALTSQANAPWPLQQISQRPKSKSTSYFYDSTAGQGTFAYVVDSGINVAHTQFGGRATAGWTAYAGKPNADTQGHGTHCAGIIGSSTYGVAKKTKLIAVKVFENGPAPFSTILDGYAWAVKDIKARKRVGKAVISMSLGGGFYQTFNDAIKSAYNAGITTVVAAGNSNVNANTQSPASAPEAITVGATDRSYAKASYSNFGPVVDIFAPGSNIVSTYIGSNSATATLSGTSMACPHISGIALYFQSLSGVVSAKALRDRIVNASSKGAVTGLPSGTPNNFSYNSSGK